MSLRKVLISPGYGAGWSTWAEDSLREDMLFDKELIEAVEQKVDLGDEDNSESPLGKFKIRLKEKHGDNIYAYLGGAGDLTVAEVAGEFIVVEYDGSESILSKENTDWV